MTKPLRVVFIRHAESENNTLFFEVGEKNRKEFERRRQADPRLTDRGVAQAKVGGRRIAEQYPEARVVMTSYLTRALQTAKEVQDALLKKVVKEEHASVVLRDDDDNAQQQQQQDEGKEGNKNVSRNDDDVVKNNNTTSSSSSSEQNKNTKTAAAAAAASSPVQVHALRDIHEVGGHYVTNDEGEHVGSPGRTSHDVLKEFPNFSVRDQEEGTHDGWWKHPTKETEQHKVERCQKLFEKMTHLAAGSHNEHRPPNDVVVVVTHGDFYKNFVKHLQHIGVDRRTNYAPLENVAISEMLVAPRRNAAASDSSPSSSSSAGAEAAAALFEVEFVSENDNEHMRTSGIEVLPPHTLSGK